MTPAEMAALHLRCFTTPRPWSAAEFATLAADPLCFTLATPLGLLVGRAAAGEAELLTLAVVPEARRAGEGRRLLAAFLDAATTRAASTAFLEVAVDNTAAIALYTAGGFAVTGRRPRYYRHPDGTPLDALVMARGLDPQGNPPGSDRPAIPS
ncbi:MAG: GNAT family N-acetyltransferase [Gemmobacter sp.]|jgi:ribosomal-protein-alanine N-acetyltransferase|nr:GNAT family N-acetyltransferase [Gemmobacter sp.]